MSSTPSVCFRHILLEYFLEVVLCIVGSLGTLGGLCEGPCWVCDKEGGAEDSLALGKPRHSLERFGMESNGLKKRECIFIEYRMTQA